MDDISYLIPLAFGITFLLVIGAREIRKGTAANRRTLGFAFLVCGLFFWVSNAMRLSRDEEFHLVLNFLTPVMLAMGVAFFFPAPDTAVRINEHRPGAQVIIGLGVLSGFAHAAALALTAKWPAFLLAIYERLGFS